MYDHESSNKCLKLNCLLLPQIIGLLGPTTHIQVWRCIITTEYDLESKVLETKEFSNSHTGRNIANELQAILSEWNLVPTMLSGITTDNGSNIVLATSILNWPRIACFSHTLQLAVKQPLIFCSYLMLLVVALQSLV